MTSHAADSTNLDFRMVYVPARDHAPGSKRPLPRGDGVFMMYPRSSDSAHSPQYRPVEGAVHPAENVGYIDEVPHTYALWEALYGVMNEHGVAMGESTCCASHVSRGVTDGGSALFTISNLMTVALERCRTAVCAVQTMGDLAERYGFYGEDAGVDGAGEAVTVVDAENDAWMFHIVGGLENRTGAMWVAQRVPPGHVAVVANSFVIQDVHMSDAENFRGSANLLEDVQAAGLWDGRGVFNWQRAMAPDADPAFKQSVNMYDPLRQWRVFSLAAPNASLPPPRRLADLPFSVRVERKPSLTDFMAWNRDAYEGTEFDMQLGALAGPWGSPRRFGGGGSRQVPGQYARSISVSWSSYTVLAQPGVPHPVLWYAADCAATSVFVPFSVEGLRQGGDGRFAEKQFGEGSLLSFSLFNVTEQPAWWAFNLVSNLMQLSYRNMSLEYVYPRRDALQREAVLGMQRAAEEAERRRSEGPAAVARLLAESAAAIQRHVAQQWWELASMLILRYNDQSFNFPPHAPTTSVDIGFPASWLEMIGFDQHSYYPRWVRPAETPPLLLPAGDLAQARRAEAARFDARSELAAEAPAAAPPAAAAPAGFSLLLGIACAGSAALGHAVGYRRGASKAAEAADAPYVRVA